MLAARELEDELRRCEKAVAEAVRLQLHSEKNIGRAARELRTASAHRDSLGGKVNAQLAAINAARGRAEDAASRMEARENEFDDVTGDIASFREMLASMRRKLESV